MIKKLLDINDKYHLPVMLLFLTLITLLIFNFSYRSDIDELQSKVNTISIELQKSHTRSNNLENILFQSVSVFNDFKLEQAKVNDEQDYFNKVRSDLSNANINLIVEEIVKKYFDSESSGE